MAIPEKITKTSDSTRRSSQISSSTQEAWISSEKPRQTITKKIDPLAAFQKRAHKERKEEMVMISAVISKYTQKEKIEKIN